MLIQDLASAGSLPVLSEMLRFAGQRQRLLTHNIANMDTPDFRPLDASPADFQNALRTAVEARRARTGGERGEIDLVETGEVVRSSDGGMSLKPKTPSAGILFHDRNNRDLERMMQDLAENGMVYRMTTDLMRRQGDLLRTAISQRV